MKQSELQIQTPQQVQLATTAEPSVGGMLQAMIERGVTGDTVAALEKLCELKWKTDERDAQRAFSLAFAELQAETSEVEATKSVPGNDGTVRYHFAPFEELMKMVKPLLIRHGFSISFDSERQEDRTISICTLLHKGGHSRSNRFAATQSAPPKSSAAQADGATKTYAKRMALLDALSIVVVGMDDDARALGAPIRKELAEDIERRLLATKGDPLKFLALYGLASFDAICEGQMKEIDEVLTRRERKLEATK